MTQYKIVDLEVPCSSRGGGTNEIKDLEPKPGWSTDFLLRQVRNKGPLRSGLEIVAGGIDKSTAGNHDPARPAPFN